MTKYWVNGAMPMVKRLTESYFPIRKLEYDGPVSDSFDIIVIGGGIAGLSVAAELSAEAHVAVLEAEDHCGYHASGRSAAILAQNYGDDLVGALTAWSEAYFKDRNAGFLSPRGLLRVGQAKDRNRLEHLFHEMSKYSALIWVEADGVAERFPLFRSGWADCGFVNDAAVDIDVAAILQDYEVLIRHRGSEILSGFDAVEFTAEDQVWHVKAASGALVKAPIVVNAAGAWADSVAERLGAKPLNLAPLRRSVATFDAPHGVAVGGLPMIVEANEAFFVKPEGGLLAASPCDETPAVPSDSRPEEIDIAICLDRVQGALDVTIKRPRATWSGLRTFAPDRAPVCGWDPEVRGVFWLAGQGGYGVQTAPALARIAADSLLGREGERRARIEGVDTASLQPQRFSPSREIKVVMKGG